MAWPSNNVITTALDEDTDNPANARPELKKMADNINLMIASLGQPNGVPSLDSAGLMPPTQLPVVPANKGGSGQSSYSVGDVLYASAFNALSKLSAGALGYALVSNGPGTAPSWQAIKPSVVTVALSGNYFVAQSDLSKNIYYGGGAYTINLPDAATVTDGFYFYVTYNAGTLTFTAASGQTLQGIGNKASVSSNTITTPSATDITDGWTNVGAFIVMKNTTTSWIIVPISQSRGATAYSASGTWTAPPGVNWVWITGVGGGGASGTDGGCPSGRGGSGASVSRYAVKVTPGTAYAVTIGAGGATSGAAGGATSFGALLTLPAGTGGTNSSASVSGTSGTDGSVVVTGIQFMINTKGYGAGGVANNAGSFNVGSAGFMLIEW